MEYNRARSFKLKVLSYWNLNKLGAIAEWFHSKLKVLSYWNLNYLAEAFYSRAST